MRIYSPSPTVAASRVPLYMQGLAARLGQDDTTAFDFSSAGDIAPIVPDVTTVPIIAPDLGPSFAPQPGFFDAVPTALDPLVAQGFTPDEADLISAAAQNGLISDKQFADILSGAIPKSQVNATIFAHPTPAPGVTPIVQSAASIAAAAKAANIAQPGRQPIAPAPRVSATPTQQVSSFLTTPVAALGGLPSWLVFAGLGLVAVALGGRK